MVGFFIICLGSVVYGVCGMSESLEMNTIPPRVNDLEKLTNTLDHRVRELENHQLPARVQRVELTMEQVQGDVAEVKKITEDGFKELTLGLSALKTDAIQQRSFMKGVMWVAAAIIGLMQFAPTISFVIKKLAG